MNTHKILHRFGCAMQALVRWQLLWLPVLLAHSSPAQEPVFSGPQVGEKLVDFPVRGFFSPLEGKTLRFVDEAGERPIVLVFIHEVNRITLRLTQALTYYTTTFDQRNLATGVILLTDDANEGESVLKRWSHALTAEAPTGIYLDGREGPGSYGLNRNVSMTILVGKRAQVTANFALVQPSVQADLPKILEAIAEVTNSRVVTPQELLIVSQVKLQGPISQLLHRSASGEAVDREAATVEQVIRDNLELQSELGQACRQIVENGFVAKLGSPRAQVHLNRWAEVYGGGPPRRSIDFNTELIPVFTKSGCNSGACHGAAAGRGGFHLSLLGSDPAADHDAIVTALEGRRINLSKPELSILLQKPTGGLDHGGDVVLDSDSEGARRLQAWISAGAPRGGARQLTRFELLPKHSLVETKGATVQIKALAKFGSEVEQDVTQWCVFTIGDPSAVEIDPSTFVARVLRPGQHIVIARFLDRVVPMQMALPLGERAMDLTNQKRKNFVDDEILKTLDILRLPVSESVDDAGFLRRVTLDLTGRLPTRSEVENFLLDPRESKRDSLIDKLLDSEAYVDFWTYRLATLLRVQPLPHESNIAGVYHQWIRQQVKTGTPLSDVATALLTGEGDSHEVGPANFSRMVQDARAQAELVSQVFMGVRLQCANCHNHPLDRWTQDDYHGFAAVFARLDRGRIVKALSRGGVTNLRTGEPAVPRIPGLRFLDEVSDNRREVAQWLVGKDNPYFAKAMVNRLWKAMFGRGLIEPTDDMRETNPATHPVLLEMLANDFAAHQFSLRHTLRLLATSTTYARSALPVAGNESDDRYYSHAYRRPLDAEVLADAIADVTGVFDQYGELPLGTRAIALVDPRTPSESLDILGRCTRSGSCEAAESTVGLPTKLHQLNGALVNRKITDPSGRLHLAITAGQSADSILRDFYLTALGRSPTATELQFWTQQLETTEKSELSARFEDLIWSLLICSEFTTNH